MEERAGHDPQGEAAEPGAEVEVVVLEVAQPKIGSKPPTASRHSGEVKKKRPRT